MHNTVDKERGFTLVEIMVAIAIVAILLAIAVPVFNRQRVKGTEVEVKSALLNVRNELVENQLVNRGSFPATVPSSISIGQGVTLTYKVSTDRKNICLRGVKNNTTLYLNTSSREPSKTACTV